MIFVIRNQKKRAAYLEQSTINVENVATITLDSDSVIPREKQNGSEEDNQEYRKIPYKKNMAKKIIETTGAKLLNKTRAKQLISRVNLTI